MVARFIAGHHYVAIMHEGLCAANNRAMSAMLCCVISINGCTSTCISQGVRSIEVYKYSIVADT